MHAPPLRSLTFGIAVLAAALVALVSILPIFALAQPCGDVDADSSVTAADALSVMRSAVGAAADCDHCVCDTDCSRSTSASDALGILRDAVGIEDAACCVLDECFDDGDCGPSGTCASNGCDFFCATAEPLSPISPTDETFEVDARPAFLHTAAAAEPDGEEGFLLVWSDNHPDDPLDSRVLARHYDGDSGEFGSEVNVSGDAENRLRPTAACAGADAAFSVAWEDDLSTSKLPDGIYLDVSNIGLTRVTSDGGSAEPPSLANDEMLGTQASPVVACLADGSTVVAWRHTCSAVERKGIVFVHYEPPHCQQQVEPPHGIFFRRFAADGAPLGPSERVPIPEGALPGTPALAELAGGGFVLLAPFRLDDRRASNVLVYSATGEGQTHSAIEGGSWILDRPSLECAANRCVAVLEETAGVVATLLDLADPQSNRRVTVASNIWETPGNPFFTLMRNSRLACGADGRCLVTWLREESRIDYDVILETVETPFARALDLSAGLFGAPAELEPPSDRGDGPTPVPAAVAPARFAVVFHGSADAGLRGRFYELPR